MRSAIAKSLERLKLKYVDFYMVHGPDEDSGIEQNAKTMNILEDEGLKMGIQKGYLLTDRKFGGSDTQATSTILSRFASTIKPAIILTGKYSTWQGMKF